MVRNKSRAILPCGDEVKRSVEVSCVPTPIGDMIISYCSRGLHMVYQHESITDENFNPDPSVIVQPFLEATKFDDKAVLQKCIKWLKAYFEDFQSTSTFDVSLLCTVLSEGVIPFKNRVLVHLAKYVPAGETITYGELATLAGSPGAQQAVGTVMATNPFQLIIPCHRVVKGGKKVGKYSGGCRNSVKVWLLQHEGFLVDERGVLSHS